MKEFFLAKKWSNKMMKLTCNSCDGFNCNTFNILFTSLCDNKCVGCINGQCKKEYIARPNVEAITKSILDNKDKLDDVLILGGEPMLFMKDVYTLVCNIKENSDLRVYITTAMPKICYDNKTLLYKIIDMVDGVNISVQHSNQELADRIRGTKSTYDRNAFYKSLPHKEKIRININLRKSLFPSRESLEKELAYWKDFGSIKIQEMQGNTDEYISYNSLYGIKETSAYANGCSVDLGNNIFLKRACYKLQPAVKKTFADKIKEKINKHRNIKINWRVLYEDGTIHRWWDNKGIERKIKYGRYY